MLCPQMETVWWSRVGLSPGPMTGCRVCRGLTWRWRRASWWPWSDMLAQESHLCCQPCWEKWKGGVALSPSRWQQTTCITLFDVLMNHEGLVELCKSVHTFYFISFMYLDVVSRDEETRRETVVSMLSKQRRQKINWCLFWKNRIETIEIDFPSNECMPSWNLLSSFISEKRALLEILTINHLICRYDKQTSWLLHNVTISCDIFGGDFFIIRLLCHSDSESAVHLFFCGFSASLVCYSELKPKNSFGSVGDFWWIYMWKN